MTLFNMLFFAIAALIVASSGSPSPGATSCMP